MRKPKANKRSQAIVHATALRSLEQGELCSSADLDMRPRVHVLGLPHTIVSEAFSHCAFTGKVLRLPDVLPDYRCIEYSNGRSRSNAAEHVEIFSEEMLCRAAGGGYDEEGFRRLQECCTVTLCRDTELQEAWIALVLRELRKRVRQGDVIAVPYPFGDMSRIVRELPDCIVVETGIGYSAGPFGAYRVFESETWRAWHFGRYLGDNGTLGAYPHYAQGVCSAVVPNYYDAEQWPLGDGQGSMFGADMQGQPAPYVFFAGRMTSSKGIEIVQTLAEQHPSLTFVVASGEAFLPDRMPAANVRFIGRVDSRADMAAWYGGALCTLVPSRFHEPFGGVAVESLLCGTPVLCSDWGGFTETVLHGNGPAADDGVRCNDPSEFVEALAHVLSEPAWNAPGAREARRTRAALRFGLEPVAKKYKSAIEMFRRMHAEGLRP